MLMLWLSNNIKEISKNLYPDLPGLIIRWSKLSTLLIFALSCRFSRPNTFHIHFDFQVKYYEDAYIVYGVILLHCKICSLLWQSKILCPSILPCDFFHARHKSSTLINLSLPWKMDSLSFEPSLYWSSSLINCKQIQKFKSHNMRNIYKYI